MRDITASNVWLIHEDQSCMVLSSAQFEKIKSLSPSTPLPELNRTSNEETLNQFNSMNDGVLNVVTTLDSNKKRYCVDDDTIGLDINGKRYYMLNSRFLRLLKAIECKLEWVPFTREYGTVGYYVNGDITLTEMEKGFVAVAYPIKFDGNIIKNTMFLGSELFGYHKNRNKYACKEGAYDGADDDGFDSEDDDKVRNNNSIEMRTKVQSLFSQKDLMEAGADSKEDDNNDDPCDESNEKAAKCRATMTLIVLPSGERWLRRTYHDAGQIHLPSHDTHSIAPIEAYKTYSASEFKQMVLDTRTEKKKKLEIPGEMVQRKNHKGVYNSYAIPSPARDETKKTHAFVANILWRTRGHVNRKSLSPKIAKEIGGNVNTASVMYNGVEYIKSTSWLCQKVHGAGKAACRTFAKVEINKDNNKLCTIVLSTDFAKATQKQASKKSTNVSKINSSFHSPMEYKFLISCISETGRGENDSIGQQNERWYETINIKILSEIRELEIFSPQKCCS